MNISLPGFFLLEIAHDSSNKASPNRKQMFHPLLPVFLLQIDDNHSKDQLFWSKIVAFRFCSFLVAFFDFPKII